MLLGVILLFSTLSTYGEYSPQRAGFSVRFKGETNPYKVMALFVMPSEQVQFDVQDSAVDSHFSFKVVDSLVRHTLESLDHQGHQSFRWRAPKRSGLLKITIVRTKDKASMLFHAFVMLPSTNIKNAKINGYRMGTYPRQVLHKNPIYRPPRGFVEVNQANKNTLLSPHFQLGQFVSKQVSKFPKYVSLRERLLLKLEFLLESINKTGKVVNGFVIMSGYRTPFYNRQLGNVRYSRHVWGGAADIYIDEHPKDGVMDDLNADGRRNRADAQWLYDFIEKLETKSRGAMMGGMGVYGSTAYHGPFVHIDVRGFRARWGRR